MSKLFKVYLSDKDGAIRKIEFVQADDIEKAEKIGSSLRAGLKVSKIKPFKGGDKVVNKNEPVKVVKKPAPENKKDKKQKSDKKK